MKKKRFYINALRTWLVSCVEIVVSSIKKTLGNSVWFDIYTREVGANDWINAGCFNQSFDRYVPLYPNFWSVSTNLSSNFLPSSHFTCYHNNLMNRKQSQPLQKLGKTEMWTFTHLLDYWEKCSHVDWWILGFLSLDIFQQLWVHPVLWKWTLQK